MVCNGDFCRCPLLATCKKWEHNVELDNLNIYIVPRIENEKCYDYEPLKKEDNEKQGKIL